MVQDTHEDKMNQAQTKDIIAVFYTRQGEKTGARIAKGVIFDYVEQVGTWLRLPNNLWVGGGSNWQYIKLLGPSTTPPPPVPVGGGYRLAWLGGSYYLHGMSFIEYKEKTETGGRLIKNKRGEVIQGLPDAVKFYETAATDIRDGTDTWRLSVEVFAKNAPYGMLDDVIEKRCRGVHKEGTGYTDYSGGDWMNTVMMANNIVYVVGDSVRKGGREVTPVKVVKVGRYDAMLKQVMDYPYLAHDATISTRAYNGQGVDPFDHLGGNPCKVVTYYKKDYVNFLDTNRIRFLADNERPSPYYPPR